MSVAISSLASILSKRAFSTFRILPLQRQDRLVRAVAALLGASRRRTRPRPGRARSCAGSRSWQSASLPGQRRRRRARPCAARSRGPCGRRCGRGPRRRPWRRCAWRPSGSPRGRRRACSLTICSTMPLTSELPSLVLVCPSNCGFGSLTAITAASPSRMSSPVGVSLRSLKKPLARRVAVDGAGQRALEADEVRAALVGVDVVGEGEDLLVVAVVPLHGDLELDAVLLSWCDVDRLVVDRASCSC